MALFPAPHRDHQAPARENAQAPGAWMAKSTRANMTPPGGSQPFLCQRSAWRMFTPMAVANPYQVRSKASLNWTRHAEVPGHQGHARNEGKSL